MAGRGGDAEVGRVDQGALCMAWNSQGINTLASAALSSQPTTRRLARCSGSRNPISAAVSSHEPVSREEAWQVVEREQDGRPRVEAWPISA